MRVKTLVVAWIVLFMTQSVTAFKAKKTSQKAKGTAMNWTDILKQSPTFKEKSVYGLGFVADTSPRGPDWIDEIALLSVTHDMPVDPVPYELWAVVKRRDVYELGNACKIYEASGHRIQNEADALKAARTLIVLELSRPYVAITLEDTERLKRLPEKYRDAFLPKAKLENGIWVVRQAASRHEPLLAQSSSRPKPIPISGPLSGPIPDLFEVRIGSKTCDIQEVTP